MARRVMSIATMLVLTTLLAAPWVLAQQEAPPSDDPDIILPPGKPGIIQDPPSSDLSNLDFDSRPSFFCGYITGNPEDKCITDENGINIAPDGTTFVVDNGVVTFSDGRTLVIDRPSDAGFLQ